MTIQKIEGLVARQPLDFLIIYSPFYLCQPVTMLSARFGWRKEYSGFSTLEAKPLDWVTLSGSLRYSSFETHDRSPMLAENINRNDNGWSSVVSLTV